MTTNDRGLRALAVHAPVPAYPGASLKKKISGVVVAEIAIDVSGRPQNVQVLEAPDAAIGQAVQEAVMRWTFRSVGTPASGSLVFYFHIRDGEGVVASPAEMAESKKQSAGASPTDHPRVREIAEGDLDRLQSEGKVVVLDIRTREAFREAHRHGAINIPLREVLTRVGAELPPSATIVIDCFPADFQVKACAVAAHHLTSSGFSRVSLLKR